MEAAQFPLPLDARMLHSEWNALGYAIIQCPGCSRSMTYPANTHIYACVCPCGWFTEVDEENAIIWHPPAVVRELLVQQMKEAGANN